MLRMSQRVRAFVMAVARAYKVIPSLLPSLSIEGLHLLQPFSLFPMDNPFFEELSYFMLVYSALPKSLSRHASCLVDRSPCPCTPLSAKVADRPSPCLPCKGCQAFHLKMYRVSFPCRAFMQGKWGPIYLFRQDDARLHLRLPRSSRLCFKVSTFTG